jgi:hypothetical protein
MLKLSYNQIEDIIVSTGIILLWFSFGVFIQYLMPSFIMSVGKFWYIAIAVILLMTIINVYRIYSKRGNNELVE